MSVRSAFVMGIGRAIGSVARSSGLRMLVLAIILVAFSIAVLASHYNVLAMTIGLGCLLVIATTFSEAGRLAASLEWLQKRSVEVRVWGNPVGEVTFEVVAVTAIGAGLLIYLRATAGEPGTLLKIAQPRMVGIAKDNVEIDDAGYMSWGGRKIGRVSGAAAVTITLRDS